jgi:hypothetical protein
MPFKGLAETAIPKKLHNCVFIIGKV